MQINSLTWEQKINQMIEYINPQLKSRPTIGVILGSGLGEFVKEITNQIVIPYSTIPHLPVSSAPGHAGNLIIGNINQQTVIVMQGRLHLYEGITAQEATLLIRVFKSLGVKTLCITAACGGLNQNFKAGDIMLIRDQINFSGTNPLVGMNLNSYGPRFPGMFDIYCPKLLTMVKQLALSKGISLQQGVYAGILGPNYATRSELQMYIDSKCDAIGMSVVHEAIIAAHSSIDVIGLAAITDMALPYALHHATENEVIESGKKIMHNFKNLLIDIIDRL